MFYRFIATIVFSVFATLSACAWVVLFMAAEHHGFTGAIVACFILAPIAYVATVLSRVILETTREL